MDRIIAGLCTLFIGPSRLVRSAVVLKPSTLLAFHAALVKRKYRQLFSPKRRGKPGPKGPSLELVVAIVETKRRNRAGAAAESHNNFALYSVWKSIRTWFDASWPSTIAPILTLMDLPG